VKELSFAEYIRSTGLVGGEIFCLLVVAGSALLVLSTAVGLYRGRHRPRLTEQDKEDRNIDWRGMLAFIGIAGVVGYFGISMAHTRYQYRYQLRPESSRYTIGRIYRHSARKRGPVFEYRYRVQGHSYEGTSNCSDGPCPPVGTYFYVAYALHDHSLSVCIDVEVPDTTLVPPAQGWITPP
jgi:hypothetical protein